MPRAPLTPRFAVVLVLALAGAALMGCRTVTETGESCCEPTLPSNLPADPQPCTDYCRVWVPPVYRCVPKLKCVAPSCERSVPVTVQETRFRDICIKPRECSCEQTCGKRCDQAAVQVRPGGWKWRRDGQCWKYCYEPPCYQWCNKVVEEDGIEYCAEHPPEYKTVAHTEPVTKYRCEYVPAKYDIVYEQEVYRPGHWEWQARERCSDCACPSPCPRRPCDRKPCLRGGVGVTPSCPRTN